MSVKLQQDHYFMKVSLLFEREPNDVVDARQLKVIIVHALQTLHGQVGAAIPVDILKCMSPSTLNSIALLRVPHNKLVKVWSALTLLGDYDGKTCVFQVLKVSASLMSLAVDSRRFEFPRDGGLEKVDMHMEHGASSGN